MARAGRRSALGHFFYDLRYRIGEYSLRGFIRFLPIVPYRLLTLFTSFMAWLAFLILWRYRERMEENIAVSLGQEIADPAARKALVWQAWHNFARTVLDTTVLMHLSKEEITATVALEGEEHLQRALEKGKGVLALSAHLGSFTMIGGRLAASGYPFSVVVKHPAHKRFAQLTDDYRTQVGIHTIPAKPRRDAVRGILKALRDNRVVLMIADEFKSGDVLVDFFGLTVPAPRGPAALALRTGAVTLPMFAIRQPDDSLVLSIGAPIESIEGEDLDSSVAATTALYTQHLEQAIRRFPAQWNWLGLPRRGDRMSRAEMARHEKQARQSAAAQSAVEIRKTGTSA
jgi:KDO2-lipid IV(A) lauroyltransferase